MDWPELSTNRDQTSVTAWEAFIICKARQLSANTCQINLTGFTDPVLAWRRRAITTKSSAPIFDEIIETGRSNA